MTAELQRMIELMARREPLDEELVLHLRTHDNLGGARMIHHPLLIEPIYTDEMAAMVNERFRAKRELFEKHLAERKWSCLTTLIEKPYRVETLVRYFDTIPEDEWWHLVHDVWTSVENLWEVKCLLPILFRGRDGTVRSLMEEEPSDLEAYDRLPDAVILYRGCKHHNRDGWSWTLNRDVAEWFAKRFAEPKHKKYVLSVAIPKSCILFYTNCRKEQECVINRTKVKLSPAATAV